MMLFNADVFVLLAHTLDLLQATWPSYSDTLQYCAKNDDSTLLIVVSYELTWLGMRRYLQQKVVLLNWYKLYRCLLCVNSLSYNVIVFIVV